MNPPDDAHTRLQSLLETVAKAQRGATLKRLAQKEQMKQQRAGRGPAPTNEAKEARLSRLYPGPTGTFIREAEATWRALAAEHYPGIQIGRWIEKEWKHVSELQDRYDFAPALIVHTIRFMFETWKNLQDEWQFRQSQIPTVALLAAHHEYLFTEAQSWNGEGQ